MSQSSSNRAIGVELATWLVKHPLTPHEEAEIRRLCKIQDQAEEAKERLVTRAQLRVAMAKLRLN